MSVTRFISNAKAQVQRRATQTDFSDDAIVAHQLRACGGDCPRCQQERAKQRDRDAAAYYSEMDYQ